MHGTEDCAIMPLDSGMFVISRHYQDAKRPDSIKDCI